MAVRYPPKRRWTGLWVVVAAAGTLVACFLAGATLFALTMRPVRPATPRPDDAGGLGAAGPGRAVPSAAGPIATVRDGTFEFVVERLECGGARVGNDLLHETAQGQFCLVTLTVKNIGDEPQPFSALGQKAHDAGGVKHDADTKASMYVNSDHQVWYNRVEPGMAQRRVVVYDIPTDARISELELRDAIFSKGVRVRVG